MSENTLGFNRMAETNAKMMLKFVSSTSARNSMHLRQQRALAPTASKIFTITAVVLLTKF